LEKNDMKKRYAKGLERRKKVMGADYVDAALANATAFTKPLQDHIIENGWGVVWQRDGLDLKTRSMITVAMLTALGRTHELTAHVRGALNNGVTREELQEIFIHASAYCGFPAAIEGFRAAEKVVGEK
jgi:4-carboxymuconolactone decarboxylase